MTEELSIEVKQNPKSKQLRLIVPLNNDKQYVFKGKTVMELIRYLGMKIIYQHSVIEHLEAENEKLIALTLMMVKETEDEDATN